MQVNEKCVGCGQCTAFCKQDAIVVKGNAYITDKCTNCGICAFYCPLKAIEAEK
jgi:MinD superfamily P-loop ATPase